MNKSRYCEECGTLNEGEYKYCKKCGALLVAAPEDEEVMFFDSDYEGEGETQVTPEELTCFVGRKGEKIVRKWNSMRFAHSRISWCWPAFLLSYFFGIAGAGFWFLYRRMYKLGAATLAVAVFLGFIGLAVNSEHITGIIIDTVECFEQSITDDGYVDEQRLSEGLDAIMEGEDAKMLDRHTGISDTFSIIVAVLSGMFSLWLYRRFAVSKIQSYGRKLTPAELTLAGGTSGGGLVVGMLFYFIAESTMVVMVMLGAFVR
ncbi:MAG: hypothetical protein IJ426_05230 [Clostridia bacterium]|nr:hypothetical protein [Clostridia bacterium]